MKRMARSQWYASQKEDARRLMYKVFFRRQRFNSVSLEGSIGPNKLVISALRSGGRVFKAAETPSSPRLQTRASRHDDCAKAS